MKKFAMLALLSMMLISSVFSMSVFEKSILPVFTGDISTVSYKIIESNDDVWIVEIDGVTYIYKLK